MAAVSHSPTRSGAPPPERGVHRLCEIVAAEVTRRRQLTRKAWKSASSRRRLHRAGEVFPPPVKAGIPPRRANSPRLALAFTLGFLLLATAAIPTDAAEPWETALARMPLPANTRELNGTNFGPTLLDAFQSNGVIKALVLLPGAIDESYFFRRARAQLPAAPTLLDAIRALESQTRIRAAFRPPCLLLHAPPDPLTPAIRVTDEATADRLRTRRFPGQLNFFDRDWPRLQPLLVRAFSSLWTGYPEIFPAAKSPDSWHFYRASIRAWNLDAREGLEALTLATRTAVTIEKRRLLFECDPRAANPSAPSAPLRAPPPP